MDNQAVGSKSRYNTENLKNPSEKIPIRTYLDQNLTPLLIDAIAETVKEQPTNPVEFVANYLLTHNPNKKPK